MATRWMGEVSPRVSVLVSSATLPLLAARFRCGPGDPAWGEVNHIGDVPHLVFPRTAVQITPLGGSTLAADPHRVMLYNAGQEYRRSPLDPRGDDAVFLAVGPAALDALAGRTPYVERSAPRFASSWAPLRASVYARLRLLVAQWSRGESDELLVDELLVSLLMAALPPNGRSPELVGVDPVAEAVRAVLAQRYRESMRLPEIAAEVGVSPFHLHRRFRAATGWTIHAYRDHLRLREGLARMSEGETDIGVLACELGYASHSHFTDRFRRVFGITPSEARLRARQAALVR